MPISHPTEPIRNPGDLNRIRSLAIPPAYTQVWICPIPNGHIQATGRDARSRKQYRYHPKWREVRDETQFGRMLVLSEVLPRIRDRKYYVHPAVFDAYSAGTMLDVLQNETDEDAKGGLRAEEAALVRLLRHQLRPDGSAANCVT